MLAADDGLMAERVEAAKKRNEVPLGIADAEASDQQPKRVSGTEGRGHARAAWTG